MKTTEAIILAGGLGTRLRSVISDVPKCIAPVNGKPFINYVIEYFCKQGIEKFVFSLGYKHEMIVDYLNQLVIHHSPFTIQYSIEGELLGTGGAIKLGCSFIKEKNVLVVNGDTLFKVDVNQLNDFHVLKKAHCTLSLKQMGYFKRYGAIELNKDNAIKMFKEKQYYEKGLVNGGVYILDKEKFLEEPLPEKFSFEKDYLEKLYTQRRIYGIIQDEYFIDIGVPEDYVRAQLELKQEQQIIGVTRMINFTLIDKTWTLFLDRDGVINGEKKDEYVLRLEDFIFFEGVLQALKILNEIFGVIVIVTNQKGVGKGLMTLDDLHAIHRHMIQQIESHGGRIDNIYYCTDLDNESPNRKPQPGMAYQAQHDFPQIDFRKSIMTGNKLTDMQFGRAIGSKTVFIATTDPETPFSHPLIDARFDTLLSFAMQFIH